MGVKNQNSLQAKQNGSLKTSDNNDTKIKRINFKWKWKSTKYNQSIL